MECDLDDPGTLGCLIALVRELYRGRRSAAEWQRITLALHDPRRLAGALVAALEAAPARGRVHE
jgi:hypothetical protein